MDALRGRGIVSLPPLKGVVKRYILLGVSIEPTPFVRLKTVGTAVLAS